MLLTLAERLMDKFVADNQVENEAGMTRVCVWRGNGYMVAAEVRLYMLILRNLGRTEKCLDVIKGKLGTAVPLSTSCVLSLGFFPGAKLRNPDELLTHELGCLHKLSRWEEMAVMIPPLLEADADQWTYTKLYVTAQLNKGLVLRKKALADKTDNKENATVKGEATENDENGEKK